MTSRQWIALAVVLGLIAATAGFLRKVGSTHRLGLPGVILAEEASYDTNGVAVRPQSVKLPKALPNYTSQPEPIDPLEASWLPQDTLFGRRLYTAEDGFRALTSVVLMGTDRTSIHKPQFCLDGQGWKIEKTETVVIPMTRPHPYDLRVMKLTAAKPGMGKGIYVYWFVTDKMLTPYHGERMWWMATDLIRSGLLQRWAYVTYFTTCWPGQEDAAYDRLKQLIVASVPEFQLAPGPSGVPGSTAMATFSGERN